jgi:hypothetical protein
MAKASDPQMLTANRLVDGDVLYWKDGDWVLALTEGHVFADPKAADAALAQAQKYVSENRVVNPYLFDVRTDAKGIHPVKEREIIRAAGPTIRDDLGKQAEGLGVKPPPRAVEKPATPKPGRDNDVSI